MRTNLLKFIVAFASREGGGVRPIWGKNKKAARESFLRVMDVQRDQIIYIRPSK